MHAFWSHFLAIYALIRWVCILVYQHPNEATAFAAVATFLLYLLTIIVRATVETIKGGRYFYRWLHPKRKIVSGTQPSFDLDESDDDLVSLVDGSDRDPVASLMTRPTPYRRKKRTAPRKSKPPKT